MRSNCVAIDYTSNRSAFVLSIRPRIAAPILAALALTAFAASVFAQEYSFTPDISEKMDAEWFGMAGGAEVYLSGEVTSREFLDFSFTSRYFGFVAATSFHQDDKYAPDIGNFPDGTLFQSYFLMDQGGLVFRGLGMELRAGRLQHHDVIDSPYTLFVSSKRLPANIINFRYENDFAFYETRWIELNKNSSVVTLAFPDGFPDRGAQLKTYGVKLGGMRFGFQDAAVYSGRSFDLEYLVSPMPGYLIQYVKGTAGRPWSTGSNENNIMGFFWDWKPTELLYLDAQVLIDDLNVWGLGGTPLNPWKAAYSLGVRYKTDVGTFSFHHALATKYTFERTRDSSGEVDTYAYSYTYYPDTRFPLDEGYASISIEDLMIGYYNGENNIAIRLDYDHSISGFDIASNLEFVLSGPKSPTNAWHETPYEEGPKLFDYSVLEKKLKLEGQVSKRLGDFVAFVDLAAGVAVNALELQAPYEGSEEETGVNANSWIWRPGDETVWSWSIGLGLRYDIPVMKSLGRD